MDVNIILDPTRLSNADADLRYLIPDKASALSGGKLADNGYGYDEEGRMIICLTSTGLSEESVCQHLQQVFIELVIEVEALTVEVGA